MKRDKQSAWKMHDGSKHSPVPETMLIGDCEMKDGDTITLVKGAPIAAKSIYWSGVRRYRTVNA